MTVALSATLAQTVALLTCPPKVTWVGWSNPRWHHPWCEEIQISADKAAQSQYGSSRSEACLLKCRLSNAAANN